MEEESLALSFGNSLTEEVSSITSEYIELGLDALMEEGLFKDIPVVSTVVSVYRIGKSIRERHLIAKLISFLNEINKGIAAKEKRQNYKEKFASNEKFRNQELEYIMVLIDRYIGLNKPQMLAKLYLAYLDEIIVWEELTMYAEIIDRFLLLDCNTLISDVSTYTTYRNIGVESILRLEALGLIVEDAGSSLLVNDGIGGLAITNTSMTRAINKERIYKRTEFGDKLAAILR